MNKYVWIHEDFIYDQIVMMSVRWSTKDTTKRLSQNDMKRQLEIASSF